MLGVGQKFPAFSLQATVSLEKGKAFKTITDQDYPGKWKVYFFWPKDFTFVCPTEIAAFGKLNREFEDRDAQILGGSTDSEFVHHAWRTYHADLKNLPFPMLADIKRELTAALGVLDPAEGVAQRATFVVDPDNVIRFVSVNDRMVGSTVADPALRAWADHTVVAYLVDSVVAWLDTGDPAQDGEFVELGTRGLQAMVHAWGTGPGPGGGAGPDRRWAPRRPGVPRVAPGRRGIAGGHARNDLHTGTDRTILADLVLRPDATEVSLGRAMSSGRCSTGAGSITGPTTPSSSSASWWPTPWSTPPARSGSACCAAGTPSGWRSTTTGRATPRSRLPRHRCRRAAGGLRIVDSIADQWGVVLTAGGGKTVWTEQPW